MCNIPQLRYRVLQMFSRQKDNTCCCNFKVKSRLHTEPLCITLKWSRGPFIFHYFPVHVKIVSIALIRYSIIITHLANFAFKKTPSNHSKLCMEKKKCITNITTKLCTNGSNGHIAKCGTLQVCNSGAV